MEGEIREEHESFPETGASWQVRPDGLVTVVFGSRKKKDDSDAFAEAQWIVEKFSALKTQYPAQQWKALVDLQRVPATHRPSLETSRTYTDILRDETLTKIALLHATNVQQAIVAILLSPVYLSDKVHFFANEHGARTWLESDHPEGARVNW